MTTISFSDLPKEIVGKILHKVPLTSLGSVRSTCKKWEAISENHLLGAGAKNQFLGFILKDHKICSMKFDLQGIQDDGHFIQPSVKEVSKLDEYEISQIFQCDGLLLCVFQDNIHNSRLMVWNMYLNQVRWIQPSGCGFNIFSNSGVFALGYDSSKNRNHKILRNGSHYGSGYEIYDFKSDSWKTIESTIGEYTEIQEQGGISLKGNAYFFAMEEFEVDEDTMETQVVLLCFDFTEERFGEKISLPFCSEGDGEESQDYVSLSCVRDEQLAVLYQEDNTLGIWISTELEPESSWSQFLKMDLSTLNGFPDGFSAGSFFIDEEKEVAVVFEKEVVAGRYHTAYIIGNDGNFKALEIGDAPIEYNSLPIVCTTAYVPSLVDIKKINKTVKRKRRDC